MGWKSVATLGILALGGCAAASPPPASPAPAPAAPAPTRLVVIPAQVLLEQGQSLRFRAVGDGPEEPAVEWSVVQGDGGPLTFDAGSITAEGVYTPGVKGIWSFVQAVSRADRGLTAMARIQVVPRGSLPIRDATGAGPASSAPPTSLAKGRTCRVSGSAEFREDAARVAGWTDAAVDVLSREFGGEVSPESWSRHRITVELLGAGQGMDPGGAGIETGWEGDACVATIRILSPSAHGTEGSTLAGRPFDEAYFRATMVHELASVALEAVTRSKGTGWGIYDAPSWFVQGHEEWLGLTCGPREAGDLTWKRYREMVLRLADAVRADGASLRVDNPYLGGTVFVGFLHEEFGKGKVRALLSSPEKEFQTAFVSAFGASPAGLLDRFRAWLER